MESLSRVQLFALAAGLGVAGVLFLIMAASLGTDIRSHVGETYQEYASGKYQCSSTPARVAADLAEYQEPEAQASDRGSVYLRYDDDIAIVGPDGNRPCTIRLQGIDEGGSRGYSGGGFIFLGPGFTPGSPAGGSGGSGGGPGDGK